MLPHCSKRPTWAVFWSQGQAESVVPCNAFCHMLSPQTPKTYTLYPSYEGKQHGELWSEGSRNRWIQYPHALPPSIPTPFYCCLVVTHIGKHRSFAVTCNNLILITFIFSIDLWLIAVSAINQDMFLHCSHSFQWCMCRMTDLFIHLKCLSVALS